MKAWGEHDLEDILSLHIPDYTEFIIPLNVIDAWRSRSRGNSLRLARCGWPRSHHESLARSLDVLVQFESENYAPVQIEESGRLWFPHAQGITW